MHIHAALFELKCTFVYFVLLLKYPCSELTEWYAIEIPVLNAVHGEPLLGVIRICYNIALHRFLLCSY